MARPNAAHLPAGVRKIARAGRARALRAKDRATDRATLLALRAAMPAWRESIPESAWPAFGPRDRRAVADVDDPVSYFLPLTEAWRLGPVLRADARNSVVLLLAAAGRPPALPAAERARFFVLVSVDGSDIPTPPELPRGSRVLRVPQPTAGQYLALLNSCAAVWAAHDGDEERLAPWILASRLAGVPVRRVVPGARPVPQPRYRDEPGYGGGPWGAQRRRTRLDVLRELSTATAGPSSAPGGDDGDTAGPGASPADEQNASSAAGSAEADGPPRALVRESRRILLAGHDLKFTHEIVAALEAGGHEVLVDQWEGHNRHRTDRSRQLAADVDVVWCEWALGNAVWFTRNVPASTRVVTRFHLQEILTDFPRHIGFEGDRHMIFVGEHVRREANRHFGWARVKSSTITNAVRVPEQAALGDPHRIGMVGVTPARKGLATALDLLEELRAVDPDYVLHLKGYRPTDYAWFRERSTEQAYFQEQYRRIEQSRLLRGAVHWDGYSADLDPWYAEMGVALSTSDFESFHFTLPDGAVRGAVPRSIAWPGSDLLYPQQWLAADAAELAESILPLRDPEVHAAAVTEAAAYCRARYATDVVVEQFVGALLG
ncbi:hypothetical protein GCM10022377_02720 [Zhihengliuella alba]|uniref:Glycosyltransferase family 1 protein n=1 Tax=Zhihengliuella alba TaxID=547018 RepID=A0ABP7CMY0_9MICC